MDPKHEIFCRQFVANNFNGTRAALAMAPDIAETTAATYAYELLRKPEIQARVSEILRESLGRLDVSVDDLTRLLWNTVSADPNELVEVHQDCCRHCYGIDHGYQFTPAEWKEVQEKHRAACERAEAMRQPPPPEPDLAGGIGYDARFPPYPECPECFGRGVETMLIKDTRTLSPAARQLYAGAKRTKSGVEVLTHSRDKALELLGKSLAMFTENVNHKNNGGTFEPMSLDAFYAKPQSESEAS